MICRLGLDGTPIDLCGCMDCLPLAKIRDRQFTRRTSGVTAERGEVL